MKIVFHKDQWNEGRIYLFKTVESIILMSY